MQSCYGFSVLINIRERKENNNMQKIYTDWVSNEQSSQPKYHVQFLLFIFFLRENIAVLRVQRLRFVFRAQNINSEVISCNESSLTYFVCVFFVFFFSICLFVDSIEKHQLKNLTQCLFINVIITTRRAIPNNYALIVHQFLVSEIRWEQKECSAFFFSLPIHIRNGH